MESRASHSVATLKLAQKESVEHFIGMDKVKEKMKTKELQIDAFEINDPNAPSSNDENKVKIVHFIRHGQGFHNLMADIAHSQGKQWTQFVKSNDNPYTMPEILDAPLTEKGRKQAILLQSKIEALDFQPQLIVTSPNCRTLQTSMLAFSKLISSSSSDSSSKYKSTIPFLAHEMVREESGVHTCDKRRDKSLQEAEFPMIDFSLLEHDIDPLYKDDRRETKEEVGERIYQFLVWLYDARKEEHVSVVSHSGWLFTIFNGILNCGSNEKLLSWFQTGELRSVKLVFRKKG